MSIEIVLAVLGAIAASFPGYVALRRLRTYEKAELQKLEIESEKLGVGISGDIVSSALSLVTPLQKRIEVLEQDLAELQKVVGKQANTIRNLTNHKSELEKENGILRDGAGRLILQVKSLRGDPVFKLDDV